MFRSTVDIQAEMLRINAQIRYLLVVTRFFTDVITSPEAVHHLSPQHNEARGMSQSRTHDSVRSATARAGSAPQQATMTAGASAGAWTVTGSFRQPEIVLFADPTKSNSRALVLKVKLITLIACPEGKTHHADRLS